MWSPTYRYFAKVDRVVDGDTVDVAIEVGMNITVHARCRLFGIDASETRGEERPKGLLAKERLRELIKDVATDDGKILVQTIKDKTGKFGRYLVILLDPVNGVQNLNETLVSEGHAERRDY